MEVLINILIVIIVIISVLKRMGEVAKKGGDITRMPTPGEMFPERPEPSRAPEMRRQEVFEEEALPGRYVVTEEEATVSDERQRTQSTRMQERLRDIQRRLDAQRMAVEEQRRSAEERFEESRADVVQTPRETRSATRVRRQRKDVATPVPVFGHGALVQGIVMSEILGPPVSLREAGQR